MKSERLPSHCMSETLHNRWDMLEVPERLPRLLHVGVLHAGNDSRSDDLVSVRLKKDNCIIFSFS